MISKIQKIIKTIVLIIIIMRCAAQRGQKYIVINKGEGVIYKLGAQ